MSSHGYLDLYQEIEGSQKIHQTAIANHSHLQYIKYACSTLGQKNGLSLASLRG